MSSSSFFSTLGRCSRGMYVLTNFGIVLVLFMLRLVLVSVAANPGVDRGNVEILWLVIVAAAHVIWSFQFVRRLHDLDMPGWRYWLLLIPFYGFPYLILEAVFQKGGEGANRYGPDPLAKAVRMPQIHGPPPYVGPQLVGKSCVHCQQKILLQSLAALCRACKQPVHLDCRKDHRSTAHPKSSPTHLLFPGLLALLVACSQGMGDGSHFQPDVASWDSGPKRARDEHAGPVHAIFRPTFATSDGTHGAGTAFLVKWSGGRYLLLTAHHVFSRIGGMTRDIEAADLPQVFHGLTARSVDSALFVLRTDKLVSIPEARILSQTDLAAFLIDDPGKASILAFAPMMPVPGARIYLLAELVDERVRLWPGQVKEASDEGIFYVLDDPSLNLNATSGAPLLDEQGRVVGINVGGGSIHGEPVNSGLSLSSIRGLLSKALR